MNWGTLQPLRLYLSPHGAQYEMDARLGKPADYSLALEPRAMGGRNAQYTPVCTEGFPCATSPHLVGETVTSR